jgi:hypothetical protein
MAILVTGNTYAANDQVTSTNLNAAVNSATFASGAVDGVSTQLSSGSIIVKDGGVSPQKLSTGGPSWNSGGTLTATAFSGPLTGNVTGNITGNVTGNVTGNIAGNVTGNVTGNINGTVGATTPNTGVFTTINTSGLTVTSGIITGIITSTLIGLTPETGYGTSGTIALNLSAASNARILLAGNSTFTVSGQASGTVNIFALKNNTGGSITTTWPAWQTAGGSFPATLTAGQAMVFVLYSYGTSLSDVYAVSSI